MADREVSWKAVANFASLIAESKKGEKALKNLRREEEKLAVSFEDGSARITAASVLQNRAIENSTKSFTNASKSSDQYTNSSVKDAGRRTAAIEDEMRADFNRRRASSASAAEEVRNTRSRASSSSALISSLANTAAASREVISSNNDLVASNARVAQSEGLGDRAKKTLLQSFAALQSAQKSYKGTADTVAAAEANHVRAVQKQLNAQNALESSTRALSSARQQQENAERVLQQTHVAIAQSEKDIPSLEAAMASARERLATSTDRVTTSENSYRDAVITSGANSSQAIAAERNLSAARNDVANHTENIAGLEAELANSRDLVDNRSSHVAAAESAISTARRESVSAARAASDAEVRVSNARERATQAAGVLSRATTRLNGEMNASTSLFRQAANAGQVVGTIFSGVADGFKDLVGMFGKLALTLLPQLIPLIGSLGGGFISLASSLAPVSGLLGALPGLLVGAVTGFAAIKGAFGGISKALSAYSTQQAKGAKVSNAAAKTANSNAKAIRNAQEGLASARKAAAEADKTAAEQVIKTEKEAASANIDAAKATTKAKRDAADANKSAALDVKKAEKDQQTAIADAADKIVRAKEQMASDISSANKNVTNAEKTLTDAQKASSVAQSALNNVRGAAIQELKDMANAARDASFSERDAALSLIDARNNLQNVKEDPHASDSDLMKAQLQYDEAKARLSDAEEAKKKANTDNAAAQAKGIKGTKAYTDANSAAAAAAQKVAEAQQGLLQAQKDQTKTISDALKSVAKAEKDAANERAAASEKVTQAKQQEVKTERDGADSVKAAQESQQKTYQKGLESIASAKANQVKTETSGADSIKKAQQGVADAHKTVALSTQGATKTADAYQTALNKLTPSQRRFVKFLISLKPKLDQLKETAASNMLPGVEAGIRGVMPLFPAFNRSVGNTAKSIGDAAATIGKTLGSGEGFGAMQRVLQTNDSALKTAAGSSGHYTIALVRIMDAARPLVTWIGSLVAKFGEYLDKTTAVNKKNGDLSKFFSETKKEAQLFGGILRSLGGIIYSIGKAAKPAGDSLWGDFGKHLKAINKDLKSDEGQKKLKKWFDDIKPIVKDVGHIFGNLGRSVLKLSGYGQGKGKSGLDNLHHILSGIADGIGPDSPLIKFFDKLNKSGAQTKTFDALGGLFTSILNFGASSSGQNVLSLMATELDLVSQALGAIAGNKVGATVLTGLMAAAATYKVAKFAGAATGINSIGRMINNRNNRRVAGGGRSYLNVATGGRVGRTGSAQSAAATESALVSGASGAASTATTQGNTIGRNIDSGIAAGIRSDNAEVTRAIDSMTNGIITHIRNNLEIHSPSKVTTRLGEQTAQGFINGINGDKAQVKAAGEGLDAAVVASLSDTDEKLRAQGKSAGLAYSQGLKSASKNAMVAAPGVVASGGKEPKGRGAAVRGAVGGAGTAAMMGSMFLPGKGGEIAGQAGMVLMLASMLPSLKSVKNVIGGITKALKLQKAAEIAANVATKAYAAAQWIANLALEAFPVILIITGLVALGVALYLLWTKSETFRKIVTGAFNAIKTAAVAVFNWFKNIGSTMFDGIKTAANNVFSWIKKHWKLILAILTAPFGGLQVYLVVKFWPQITGFLSKLWGWIKGAFKKLWSGVKTVLLAPFNAAKALINQFTDSKSGLRHILSAVWNWVKGVFKKAWNGITKIFTWPIDQAKKGINNLFGPKSGIRKLMSALWQWVSGTFKRVWKGLQKIFTDPIGAAKNIINNLFGPKSGIRKLMSGIWHWVSGTFKRAWNGLQSIITTPISKAKGWISSALGAGKGGIQKIFSDALAGIKRVWNGLKSIAVSPINFMRTKVMKGLASAYNWVVGKIPGAGKLKIDTNSGHFKPIKLAKGGRVTGNSPTPTADNVPAMLTAGEWVQPVSTVKHYGASTMEAIRQRRIPKSALAKYAGGGYVSDTREDANLRKQKKKRQHLRDGGMAGSSNYALSSQGGAVSLRDSAEREPVGDGVTRNGASVPYRPGMRRAMDSFIHRMQAMYGVSVLEHEPWDHVDPVHMKGSLHYVGQAADLSGGRGWPGSGDKIFRAALAANLGAIWKSKGHYNHVHVDTGLYDILHDQRVEIPNAQTGGGNLGDFISNSFSSLKDLLGGLNPLDKLKSGINKVKEVADSSSIGQLLGKVASAPLSLAVSALKNAFFGSEAYEGNASLDPAFAGELGVERWRKTVEKALKMNGIKPTDTRVQKWLTQIAWESSGNSKAIQGDIGDVNNRTGQLARGLVQVVPGTFRAYHLKGHNDIFNGLDNLLAGINYAKHVYGASKMFNFIGTGKKHGYSEGGYTGSGGKYEPAGVVHKGEVVWSQSDVAAHGGAHKVDSMRKHRGSRLPGYATGGIVAPPSGKPIRGIAQNSGSYGAHNFAWKMIRQLLGLKTKRGMKIPFPDRWDSEVTRAFVKKDYTIPGLSSIQIAKSVDKYVKPVTSWLQKTMRSIPGRTNMEKYPSVSPRNYKKHPNLTREIQKVMGMKVDGVWGSNMSKGVVKWKKDHNAGAANEVNRTTWEALSQQKYPKSYTGNGVQTSSSSKFVRLEDVANKYGLSMFQARPLFTGKNRKYIDAHTTAATRRLVDYDADQMSGTNSWIRGNFVKSYQKMFGVPKDGVWTGGMSDWLTYAMRKSMNKPTKTIFPPWWTLDPLQKGIEDQDKNNKDQAEFLKDLDTLSGWGLGYLVDKLQNDGVEEGLPVARVAVKNKTLAKQYDDELKTKSNLESTGSEDFTKFVSTVLGDTSIGIRKIAQTLGIADFAVVDMYDKLMKSGRLKKGQDRTLDREVSQFNKGLFYAATGGQVPGTGTGDRVPAMLTPGEFVLKKAAVKAIGLENLYNLNNMQKLSTGGEVYSFSTRVTGRGQDIRPIQFDRNGLARALGESDRRNTDTTSRDGKVINNYTTINNPTAEKSTASVNKLLRKKAALGFMAVEADVTKVNG